MRKQRILQTTSKFIDFPCVDMWTKLIMQLRDMDFSLKENTLFLGRILFQLKSAEIEGYRNLYSKHPYLTKSNHILYNLALGVIADNFSEMPPWEHLQRIQSLSIQNHDDVPTLIKTMEELRLIRIKAKYSPFSAPSSSCFIQRMPKLENFEIEENQHQNIIFKGETPLLREISIEGKHLPKELSLHPKNCVKQIHIKSNHTIDPVNIHNKPQGCRVFLTQP